MKNNYHFVTLLLLAIISTSVLKAANVNGKALYQNDVNRPIGYVTVVLKNIDNNATQAYITGADGFYEFTDVPKGNYTLTGTTNIASTGGTFYDAVLVYLNIAKVIKLSPIQLLAADVNGNNKVEMGDFNLILQHILRNKPYPAGPWKFIISEFTVTDMKSVDVPPTGLGGTCSGDVGGTFIPTAYSTPVLPVAQEGVTNVSEGESFTTQILTHNNLSLTGAGLIINFPSELMEIESIEFKGADYEYNIENGQIRLVWGNPETTPIDFKDGEPLLTIHGVSTAAFKEGMTASMSIDGSTSLVSSSNNEVSNLKFASPLIKFGKPALKLSNYPNPFKNSTKLNIYSPETGNAIIEVYSTSGQLVKRLPACELNAGHQEIDLDASQLAKGYYVCKIRIQGKTTEYANAIRLLKAE
jgi:hypothetical protein